LNSSFVDEAIDLDSAEEMTDAFSDAASRDFLARLVSERWPSELL
jgi:hypothetical protein